MGKTNEYICNDDGFLDKIRDVRDMTDEEFAEYINKLKKAEEGV